eukprot:Hpha_TRINITY_DN15565_c4_g7::TRINITY_DN15565_c4_g7_i1::g.108011::m.108011/K00858/ppnK, NADK; NAD+ kinase
MQGGGAAARRRLAALQRHIPLSKSNTGASQAFGRGFVPGRLGHTDSHAARLAERYTVVWDDAARAPLRRRGRLMWERPVRRILLVKKRRHDPALGLARIMAEWLHSKKVTVCVEPAALHDFGGIEGIVAHKEESPAEDVDLVIALGGDGTLLHVSRLFDKGDLYGPLPPCLVIGMGTLGFLANFQVTDWMPVLTRVLDGEPMPVTMRTRLRCAVVNPDGSRRSLHHVLNECAVATRRQGALGKLALTVDGDLVTQVEGDGLIIATPTGSTGYNLSCMGPIVSPSVPATLITPIAPHSLSFRPVIASELSAIEVHLPVGARSGSIEVSCDGRLADVLPPGGSVRIRTSRHPLPVLTYAGLDRDWFQGITTKLQWNVRGATQPDDDPLPPHGEDAGEG